MTRRKQAIGRLTRTPVLLALTVAGLAAVGVSVVFLRAAVGDITLTPFSTNFNTPVGIDFHEDPAAANGIGDLILSANYPTGEPFNLNLIAVPSGLHAQFSTLHGLTDELKVATVRTTPVCQQFPVGDVFTGTGKPGEIVRIDSAGNLYSVAPNNPGAPLPGNGSNTSWVQLPGEPTRLRGSLYVDRSCAFGGDLIVVTANTGPTDGGDVWRVKVDGTAQLLASITDPITGLGVHLEGVITLALDPKYGPWAGTILAGDETFNGKLADHGRVWSITPGGVATAYNLEFDDASGLHFPVKPEDFDLIEAGQNFFGVNYGNSRILTASSQDLAPFVGDILLTQELPCGSHSGDVITPCIGSNAATRTSGLYAVRFVGTGGNAAGGLFRVTPFTFTGGSVTDIDQWEHVTLAPIGNPHLTITKSPKGATFQIGQPLTFTIVVKNDGVVPAHNVTLSDPLPTTGGLTWSVTSVTPSHPCSINGGQVMNCTFGDLNPNDAVTVVVTTNNVGGAPVASCTGQKLNNIATADSDDTDPPVTDTGDYTCTPAPAVTIVKFTNGADANDPNAAGVPNIPTGGVVTWTYRVTNTGNVPVPRANVAVTDNTTGVTPTFTSEISGNGDTIFNPGEVWLYTATGTALDLTLPAPAGVHTVANSCTAGGAQPPRTAYTNVGTVTIPGATANDPSSYCNPPAPSVTIIKFTNGADANDPNAAGVPNIPTGGVVTWTYRVTNTGNVPVPRANVVVTDNTTGVTPTFTSVITGNADTIFDPGEVWLYTATGTALDLTLPAPAGVHTVANSCTAGGTQPPRTAYTNVGTVTIPGATANDPSSYCNPPAPNVTIVKFTNGADANDPNAAGVPNVATGGVVTWTYRVTNTGNVPVARANVVVTDNTTGVTPTFTSVITGNADTIFDPGEVWLYTATGTALDLTLPAPAGVHTVANSCTAGGTQPPRTAYTNVGTVTIPGATANDPSSYCNPPGQIKSTPLVAIKKFTNGADANDPNAAGVPNIPAGGAVTWTYRVANVGDVAVPRASVLVTDNTTGVTPTFTSEITGNGDTIFDPGEVWLYTATGTALDLTLPAPAGVHTVANSCTAGGTQPPRTAYTNVGRATIPGATDTDPSSYCNPPGKSFTISGSMEGNLSNIKPGDWVSGGYSFKFVNGSHVATSVAISGTVSIAVKCSQGGGPGGTIVVPLNQLPFGASVPSIAPLTATVGPNDIAWGVPTNYNNDWFASGDQNNVWVWSGAVQAPDLCGGKPMDDIDQAVFNATVSQTPATGSLVDFRFHYRDPAAKGKANTNCLDTNDPNRAKADVCGASWSGTKRDP